MSIGMMLGCVWLLRCAAQDSAGSHKPFHGEPDVRAAGVRRAADLAAVDFNGDGSRDLGMLAGTTGQMAVILSQGGSFQNSQPKLLEVGHSASGMAIGEFNGDGKLDCAVSHHDTDEIWILMGRGDGTFEPARTVRVPAGKPHVHKVVTSDLNRDRHLDLMLAQADDNRVWALLGDGKGGFAPCSGAPWATGNHPYVVACADFNRDSYLDIATPNWYGKSVSVFLGDGSGGFKEAPKSPLTGFKAPTALDAGDVTGDGLVDLALGQDDSSEIQILVGDGGGAFALGTAPPLRAQDDCFTPTLVDLNQDGRLDVIANAQNRGRTFSYWINLGGGKFSAAQVVACPASAVTLCVADLNGDGAADLAAGTDDSDQIHIWFGKKR